MDGMAGAGWPGYNWGAMAAKLPLGNEQVIDHSDATLVSLLEELKKATDPAAVQRLSAEIERVIFHKQLGNA